MAVNSITRANIRSTFTEFLREKHDKPEWRAERYFKLIDELATMAAEDGFKVNADRAGLVILDAITLGAG